MKAQYQKTNAYKHRRRKSRTYHRRMPPPGTPPGPLVADPEAPHPVIRILAYGPEEVVEQEITEPRRVRDFLPAARMAGGAEELEKGQGPCK